MVVTCRGCGIDFEGEPDLVPRNIGQASPPMAAYAAGASKHSRRDCSDIAILLEFAISGQSRRFVARTEYPFAAPIFGDFSEAPK